MSATYQKLLEIVHFKNFQNGTENFYLKFSLRLKQFRITFDSLKLQNSNLHFNKAITLGILEMCGFFVALGVSKFLASKVESKI